LHPFLSQRSSVHCFPRHTDRHEDDYDREEEYDDYSDREEDYAPYTGPRDQSCAPHLSPPQHPQHPTSCKGVRRGHIFYGFALCASMRMQWVPV